MKPKMIWILGKTGYLEARSTPQRPPKWDASPGADFVGSGRRICGHLVMPHNPFFGLTEGGRGKLAYPWLPREQHGPGAPFMAKRRQCCNAVVS